jgi:hypothetical protein
MLFKENFYPSTKIYNELGKMVETSILAYFLLVLKVVKHLKVLAVPSYWLK